MNRIDTQTRPLTSAVGGGKGRVGRCVVALDLAYADFVTAMMALFIVLWLLTQSHQASRERIAQYFRTGMLPGTTLTVGTPASSNPSVAINIFLSGGVGDPSQDMPDHSLQQQIEVLLKSTETDPEALEEIADHLRVKPVAAGTLIELVDGDDDFMFPVGSAGLKPRAIELLQTLAPIFAKLRNKVEVHGHTDARRFDDGAKKGNWDLSFERANEARRALESAGVPAGRIVAVQARPDTPLLNEKDPMAPENRRLSLLIVRDTGARSSAGTSDNGNADDDKPDDKPAQGTH